MHDEPLQTVVSRDGTPIAFWRSGAGPPLLLVHGAIASHDTTWRLVLPHLEQRFTVYAMDRRGRGASGDGPGYDLQREADDVAAVVNAIGERVNVLGHSYGALCAIEAALETTRMRRLVLYEGVYLHGSDVYPPGLIDRLEAMLASGRVDDMLVTLLEELVEMPSHEIALLRADVEAWAIRVGNAPTVPRELRTDAGYVFEASRFERMRTPSLFLVGGNSPTRELEHATAVARALPDARVALLPGQQHLAMYTAPDLFVQEVVRFIEE